MKTLQEDYNRILEKISDELDIPPSKYQQAVKRYSSVGEWLNEIEDPELSENIHIYVQGSFRLGTVIRPIIGGVEADYDIDLVCKLPVLKESSNPQIIKEVIGDRLKENGHYERMLDEEGKRCWTLNYADESDGIGFHMDILPSIQEDSDLINFMQQFVPFSIATKAIAITNKLNEVSYEWKTSNPDGYAEWFDERKRPIFNQVAREQKEYIFSEHVLLFKSVDKVPDQLVKTPLQRAIQILKRHRDSRFQNHQLEKYKPISMIITTLSAQLYQQEEDVFVALKNIIEHLNAYSALLNEQNIEYFQKESYNIIKRNNEGTWSIPNPVNPDENFADKWHEDGNIRALAFFGWVSWLKADLVDILDNNINEIRGSFEFCFGETLTKKAFDGINSSNNYPNIIVPVRLNEPEEIINPSKPWRKND